MLFPHEASQILNTPISPDLNSPFIQPNGVYPSTHPNAVATLAFSSSSTVQISGYYKLPLAPLLLRPCYLIKMGLGLSSLNFHCSLCQHKLATLCDSERRRLRKQQGQCDGQQAQCLPSPTDNKAFFVSISGKKKNKTFKEGFLKQHNEIALQILLPRMRGEVRENTKSFV